MFSGAYAEIDTYPPVRGETISFNLSKIYQFVSKDKKLYSVKFTYMNKWSDNFLKNWNGIKMNLNGIKSDLNSINI